MNEEELSHVFAAAATLGEGNKGSDAASHSNPSSKPNLWAELPPDARNLIGCFVGASIDEVVDMTYVSKLTFPHSEEIYAHLLKAIAQKGFFNLVPSAPKEGDKRSWLNIAKNRKRLRTNGFYSLKEMITRAPSNDQFWEERKVKAIETIHYRYLRFLDNGSCIYSIQTFSPWENPLGLEPIRLGMEERELRETHLSWFTSKKPTKLRDNVFFGLWWWGDEKGTVCIRVKMPYCELEFKFLVLNGRASYGNYHGNNSVLQCTRHAQVCEAGTSSEFALPINRDYIFHRRDYMCPDDRFHRA